MERMKEALKERLTVERFEHVLRVTALATSLAKKHSVSVEEAEQAALLHDIAKCMDKDTLRERLQTSDEDQSLLAFHHELWHGPVGAVIAREEFGVVNKDVLNAVRYHTTGRAHMSQLEKLIFVADLIEPGRNFPGIDRLRDLANQSIDAGMEAAICHSMDYLLAKRVAISPDAFHCYNEYMFRKK